jgi:anthranilate synthase component 1
MNFQRYGEPMTPERFAALAAEGYNRIPLIREVFADLETPLSAYLKLADGPYSYLFESVHGGEVWGRYSFIGLPCRTVLRVNGRQVVVETDGEVVERAEEVADPLHWIDRFRTRFRLPDLPGLPRFTGGLVGYFGYDSVRYIELRLGECPNPDPLGTPDVLLLLSEEILIFDNLSGKLKILIQVDPGQQDAYREGCARLDTLVQRLRQGCARPPSVGSASQVNESDFVSGSTQEGFEDAVRRIKDYIVEGDVMQVVLSQRLSIPYRAPTLNLYRALRSLNPSPYLYCLNLSDFYVVGSSPEILVRLEDEVVTVRPIAGTRPRGGDEEEDLELERELLADPKECAEHLMLIDLGRNDVGRVVDVGSVQLTEKMVVERYSHVMHIVSNVRGRLRRGLDAMDVLRATFPAGTVSGAPKIRAMEIIDELEPVKRGVYSGAVGYLSWSGNMDTAIAIRTAVVKDGILHVQVGAGIVADSVPHNEWEETMNKGRAMFRAVSLAESGLDGAAE